LNDREKQFIQTCGKNEDGFLKAWEKIGNTITDFRKKRNEDAKKQLDRWKSNKQRIDES
jgi:nitrate/TMAO reductase-like tetraheme cytochrome c subunit